jgi:hypothetical protein
MRCCVPLYWFHPDDRNGTVLHNGTVTLVRPDEEMFGITAAHVIRGYQRDRECNHLRARLASADLSDLPSRVIDISDELDLATIDLRGGVFDRLGWDVFPLSLWPPAPPEPDRGIMFGGFPAKLRQSPAPGQLAFGPFCVLSVARRVESDQITWRFAREFLVNADTGDAPEDDFDLGGISGGPLLRVGESPSGLIGFRLAGIVSQSMDAQYVVAKRADFIQRDGTIRAASYRQDS